MIKVGSDDTMYTLPYTITDCDKAVFGDYLNTENKK